MTFGRRKTLLPGQHKYNVGPPTTRQFNGRTYHSAAECARAQELELLRKAEHIVRWDPQIKVQLGDGYATVVDFMVTGADGTRWAEEVKGYHRGEVGNLRARWEQHGPCPLLILTRKRNGWQRITVRPTAPHDTAKTAERIGQ